MRVKFLTRSLLTAACVFVGNVLPAQQLPVKPSAPEAAALLQTRPDLVAQLRQRLITSGLSKDQIHARLKAEGYPEDLLDSYLPGASGSASSPTTDIFAAVKALGIADSSDVARLLDPRVNTKSQVVPGAPANRAAAVDSGFAVFGMELFNSGTTQFDANIAGPVDANYRVNAGDRLVLIITGDLEESYQLDVTREGFVVVPTVGQIYVANLTLGQIDQVFSSRLARVYSGVRPNHQGTTRFSLSVSKLRSNQIYVIGDVQKPSSYIVSSTGTALTALYAAGGPSPNGSYRRVEIRRNGRAIDTLDVYDYLLRGDANHDVRLETGDVVFVPPHGAQVRIVGEIVRPATYELKATETLADLVRNAGGFRATASRQRVLIDRIVAPGVNRQPGADRITLDIGADALFASSGAGVALQNGDVVRVFPIAERVRNRVFVSGNVYLPGDQGITPGEPLSAVIRRAGGIKPDTYLGEVEISRLKSDGAREFVRAMFADSLGRLVNDIPVREDDQITVYSITSFRPPRYVAITGAVWGSGRYPYRDGMTLRDLVLIAKGLTEFASLTEAEIARMPEDRATGTLAQTFRVALDSTYIFERKPNGEYSGPPGLPYRAGGAPEVLLRPYDNVLILEQPSWDYLRNVTLTGEVRYAGTYVIRNKKERLSDVIARAGGLTDDAYPLGAVFTRSQLGLGRIGVDLPTALSNADSPDNLFLTDGDSLFVPRFSSIVTIRGAVNAPTSLAFVPGRNIEYYVDAAGGPTLNADLGRAYVVQPGGRVESTKSRFLFHTTSPRPQPGATIYVPVDDPTGRKDFITFASQIGQIIAGLATLFIIAKR